MPPISAPSLRWRNASTFAIPCGSGSTNASLRPGSAALLGGLLGSKQYCVKHFWQKSERAMLFPPLVRARSSAAHCRHLPNAPSGLFELGVKPPSTFACTLSRNDRVWMSVYTRSNVPVLASCQHLLPACTTGHTHLDVGSAPVSGGEFGR
jgi:hypothetical protein